MSELLIRRATIRLTFDWRGLGRLLFIGAILLFPLRLVAETLQLSVQYPAATGLYRILITKGQQIGGVDQNTLLARNGGQVGILTPNIPAQRLTVGTAGGGYNQGGMAAIDVRGDVALNGQHALRSSDTWLRLNDVGAFTETRITGTLAVANGMSVGDPGAFIPPAGVLWVLGSASFGNLGSTAYSLSASGHIHADGNIHMAAGPTFGGAWRWDTVTAGTP